MRVSLFAGKEATKIEGPKGYMYGTIHSYNLTNTS